MATGKLLQFPIRNRDLFSREINSQVLSHSEFNRILCAAIRALPHVSNSQYRENSRTAAIRLARCSSCSPAAKRHKTTVAERLPFADCVGRIVTECNLARLLG